MPIAIMIPRGTLPVIIPKDSKAQTLYKLLYTYLPLLYKFQLILMQNQSKLQAMEIIEYKL